MVLFLDMNSFFASCEQQVNYYLRGRPVGVCVYPGKFGAIISPSVEAKLRGVKTGMRLNEAMQICPELVPLETHPQRYRDFHKKIMKVLQKYGGDEVIPKSIDEALINLKSYELIYKTMDAKIELAKQIKDDIRNEVGDWLRCSVGIAPNGFLAKLASDIQKPDGLTIITPDNIDEVLSKLKLTDLPGIAGGMAKRFALAGIDTPLKLRHTDPAILKRSAQSIVGLYWHYRLNFSEVDMITHPYKNMQAMRHLSQEQRRSKDTMEEILVSLCMTLEKRMVKHEVYARELYVSFSYNDGYKWKWHSKTNPLQDGARLWHIIKEQMDKHEKETGDRLLNFDISGVGINVSGFVTSEVLQIELFENNVRQDTLRRAVYDLKDRFGYDKLLRGIELDENSRAIDIIGFGNIKDMQDSTDMKNFNTV